MRILFLNAIGELGGSERVLLDVMASLGGAPGVEMGLILLSDGPLNEEAAKLGVSVTVVPLPPRLNALGESGASTRRVVARLSLFGRSAAAAPAVFKYLKVFNRAVADFRPDVIHSNGMKTHLLTRMIRYRDAAIVWHIHDLIGRRPLMGSLLRRAAGRTRRAIAISDAVARDLRSVLPGVGVSPILNAIDVGHFSPRAIDPNTLDLLAGIAPPEEGTVRVGLVATYARWKGQDLFLRAAARVGERRPELKVRFYIAGGPIYKTAGSQFSLDELKELAGSLGVSARVGFVPFQRDPADLYRALDVVVHASTEPEPFGRTIAEAMACGRAVIVSRAGGAAELFEEGVDALGFSPGDPDALAGQIERLVAGVPLRTVIADRARSSAVRRFDRSRLREQFLDAYAAAK